MKKKLKIIALASLIATISGCVGAMPEYKSSQSTMIVFKTQSMRYADQGFISRASSETKVEIYGSGQAVMRLRITPSQVCVTKFACLSKKEFNKKVLGNSNYPETLIENIFNGNRIFNSEGISDSGDSFTQNIVKAGMSIYYYKDSKKIEFNDTITGVKIKVINMN